MSSINIYTAKPCGYCNAAIRFLTQVKNVEVNEIDLTHNHEKRRELVRQTGHRTVPMIFIGDKFIGGYDELRSLDAQKLLDQMLEGEGK